MEYVTYLLGAGASYGEPNQIIVKEGLYPSNTGLPIINTMLRRFKLRKTQVMYENEPHSLNPLNPMSIINENSRLGLLELYTSLISHYEYADEIRDVKSIEPLASRFATIDTYLKSLYHTNKPLFESLKLQLDQFFILEQMLWKVYDHRYLNLLTTISNLRNLPNNVNFITWNYDFMLQEVADGYAAREFSQGQNIWMSAPGLVNSYPAPGNYLFEERALKEEWSIICLNGRAGIYIEPKPVDHIIDISLSIKNLDINDKVKFILNEYPSRERMFSFAWENRPKSEIYQEPQILLEKQLRQTTIMIIIGYSFPFFNREIDSKIFKNAKNLRKIIYQQPITSISAVSLVERFNLNSDVVKLQDVYNCDQFYIPVEL